MRYKVLVPCVAPLWANHGTNRPTVRNVSGRTFLPSATSKQNKDLPFHHFLQATGWPNCHSHGFANTKYAPNNNHLDGGAEHFCRCSRGIFHSEIGLGSPGSAVTAYEHQPPLTDDYSGRNTHPFELSRDSIIGKFHMLQEEK